MRAISEAIIEMQKSINYLDYLSVNPDCEERGKADKASRILWNAVRELEALQAVSAQPGAGEVAGDILV